MARHRVPWTFQAVGILLALSGSASAQFTRAPNPFPVGHSPKSVVVGNFNGNSTPSIAVANQLDNTVTLLSGDGTGGFIFPGRTFAVGQYPGSMAVGDFNKDNYQDLVVANEFDNTVTVLLNDKNGGFTLPGRAFPAGNGPSSVAVGDFDGDGYLDLAIANRDSNNVTVLLNDKNGGFTLPGRTFPVGNSPSSVAVGDFNGDGIPDLAIANELDNTVTVLLGNPSGGFRAATVSPFAVGYNPTFVVVADFNGDGNPDFATANLSGNNVTVLLGNGTGGFTPAPASPAVQGTRPVSMAVGDFNGDYVADLAIADFNSNNVTVLLGNGTGGFKPGPGSPYAVGTNPVSVAVGDFNADGVPDLAIVNTKDDDVIVLLNTFVTTPVMVSAASYSPTAPVAPGSMVSIFGTASAAAKMIAPAPLTTCLEGIGVTINDFSGVKIPLSLFYAGPTQTYAGPTQINAEIPPTAATGAATFTISTSPSMDCSVPQTGVAQKGSVTLAAVAPGLFTANATGKGLAAGFVSDLATGVSSPVSTSPIPDVKMGASILVLYGTGIRNRAKLSDVTVTIGSQTLSALFAGPAPGDSGVDQVNVALPSTLAGSGTVYVTVSTAGTTSNQVTLYIQ